MWMSQICSTICLLDKYLKCLQVNLEKYMWAYVDKQWKWRKSVLPCDVVKYDNM